MPRKKNQREKAVEQYLLTQCRRHGLFCLKFVSPARGGVPDRIVLTPIGTVFVEVKRPGGDLEKRQRVMHAKMRRFGAEIHVVDDEQAVDAFITHVLGYRRIESQQKAAS
ncbi:VRR-NUC domain-containing protein [Arthrobacter sp. NtRootA1]|uniref:VRR-NUC domain-containing protein n=1 Tax=Arthrobacter sp. NtRootA1 TaxID=2830983 RepID=UPI001CC5866A|nr:VRR-NUC domain-containing protein [Arthrobacter sp. NtRootA1]BCW06873.1 nuclease [Arthrobacter sp. NtRootA1]